MHFIHHESEIHNYCVKYVYWSTGSVGQMHMTVQSTELGAVGGPTTPVPGAFHYLHIAAI